MKITSNRDLGSGAIAGISPHASRVSAACDEVSDLLSLYADGEATGEQTAMVETHIAVCNDCSQDLAFMRMSSVAFASLAPVSPPADLRAAIFAATIERPGLRRRLSALIHRLLSPAPARYGFAVAAGLAGILVAVAIHRNMPAGELVENPAIYRPAPQLAQSSPKPAVSTERTETRGNSQKAAPAVTAPKPAGSHLILARKEREEHSVRTPSSMELATARETRIAPRIVRGAVQKVSPRGTVPTSPMTVASGEMKIKPLVADRPPVVSEEGTTRTADMVVMTDPAPMKTEGQPATMAEKSAEAAGTTAPRFNRILLTSSLDTVGQVATFAELKRALKHRDLESAKAIEQSIKAGEIRVPVLRRSF